MKRTLFAASLALIATPLLAQPMGRGPGAWDHDSRWDRGPAPRRAQPTEGKVEVETFVGENPAALGQGGIVIVPPQVASEDRGPAPVYEAALLDGLVGVGYNSAVNRSDAAQSAELRLVREIAIPEEERRKPVSGEMMTTFGTHGSSMGMAINVDLTKPRKAMVSTRIEARIRDRASGAVIWEGHAEMLSREDSDRWTDQAIAAKLTAALLRDFPRGRE
jgi:hypothetical protein